MSERQTPIDVNAVSILGEAKRVYVQHAAVVISTSALIQAAQLALTFLAMNTLGLIGGVLVMTFLAFVTTQLTLACSMLLLLHLRSGHGVPTVSFLLGEAADRLGPLLLLSLRVSLGLMLGFICFVVPGVILSIRWAVAAPALIAHRIPASQATGASARISKGHGGSIFLVTLAQSLFGFGLSRVLSGSGQDLAVEDLLIVQAVVGAIGLPFGSLAVSELFFALSGFRPTSVVSAEAALAPHLAQAGAPGLPATAGAPAIPGAHAYAAHPPSPPAAYAHAPAGAYVPQQPYGAPPVAAAQAHVPPMPPPQPVFDPTGYGAPAATAPQPYGAPAAPAPQPYGAPPATPPHQPHGAAPAMPPHQPYGGAAPTMPPPQAYAAPAVPPQQAYGAAPAMPPQPPYGAPAPPPAAPAPPQRSSGSVPPPGFA